MVGCGPANHAEDVGSRSSISSAVAKKPLIDGSEPSLIDGTWKLHVKTIRFLKHEWNIALIDQIGGWRWLTSAFSITFLLEAAVFWILRNIGYLERLIRGQAPSFHLDRT